MRRLSATTLCASLLAIVLPCVLDIAHAQALGVVQVDRVDYNEVEPNPITENAAFGESLARLGDFLLVGARNADGNDGAVYVFRVESDGSLTYLSKLVDQENPNPFYFGQLLTGDQGWAAIRDVNTHLQLFEQTGDAFVFHQAFSPETLGAVEMTGFDALDMSGSTLMVSDQDAYIGGTERPGAVGVYERSSGTWALQSMIPNPLLGALTSHQFGDAVAIAGDLAVITDPTVEEAGDATGRAYLYERDANGTWQLLKELRAKVEDYGQRFARSVAVDQDTVAVGCAFCNNEAGSRGSIYVYERNQGGTDNWGLAQEITGAVGGYFPLFEKPQSLYLRGDVLAFGTGTTFNNKFLVVYTRAAGMPFSQWAFIDESADGSITEFGYAIDGTGTSIVVGAPNWPDDGDGLSGGAAYAYRIVQPCHGPDTIYCDGFEGFQ